jgi:hypothetical protein
MNWLPHPPPRTVNDVFDHIRMYIDMECPIEDLIGHAYLLISQWQLPRMDEEKIKERILELKALKRCSFIGKSPQVDNTLRNYDDDKPKSE